MFRGRWLTLFVIAIDQYSTVRTGAALNIDKLHTLLAFFGLTLAYCPGAGFSLKPRFNA
ncbi:MAG: hypothetical protein KME56_03155 [Candidatus Thiodiazotropha sp. (ex Ctena orbiculata)]|uniref:Uncharacterized protein n=1 Tax=Candidatus Thiodiazotropha taylori TaxID=2792791 RepID=A0A944M8I1_9GAMM|nr:hypothetical protein [Candidatus Thiodiazotropha taylori]MBT2989173.1 hypothetical protein [Candidatus Thiodiazotropha taylori]MBT2995616.1 hypothetical protein [Candidatus Thiodiazotropha taylori]MBT2999430.1 hypothetical protein [Candidatus Thiodiazotropha taylori]MBT3025663.1 hypothetical protein [Candidatus Thiodiazotropha taylori]